MGQLTTDMIAKLCDFRQDRIDALTADLNDGAAVDAISTTAQACSLTRIVTEFTVSGTMTATLAAPTYVGQKKILRCVSGASTPKLTLTVSSPDDTTGFVCSSTFIFDTAGQEIELEATAALKWRAVRVKRAGGTADNVVIGTTVLTGYNLWAQYCCSVTDTVSSTGTKALPNGSAIGETVLVGCSTAGGTPVGNINFTGVTSAGAAATDLQAIGATTDYVSLQWTGTAWLPLVASGITVA